MTLGAVVKKEFESCVCGASPLMQAILSKVRLKFLSARVAAVGMLVDGCSS